MNILVTGANGQLGSEIKYLVKGSTNSYLFTDLQELDITDLTAVNDFIKHKEIAVVINCAAYTNVDKAESDRECADRINNQAVGYLAQSCKALNALLIHISTDYIFNGNSHIPYTEGSLADPLGVYGETKFAGEQAIVHSGCRYMIFRTSWLFSSYGNNFVKTMQRLTAEKDSLMVVSDQIGSPTYAADLAILIVDIIEGGMLDKEGVYNFSNDGVCSWYDFAIEIAKLCKNSCNITPCRSDQYPTIAKRPKFSVLDKTKVTTIFAIKIPHWKEALERCLDR